MRAPRSTLLLLSAACLTASACANEVTIGDVQDRNELHENEELAELALQLEGTWTSSGFGTPASLTFTPGPIPRSGTLSVKCANEAECDPFAGASGSDAGSGYPTVQLFGNYELVELVEPDLAICVFSSSGGGQSMTANLAFDESGSRVDVRLPLASISISLTR